VLVTRKIALWATSYTQSVSIPPARPPAGRAVPHPPCRSSAADAKIRATSPELLRWGVATGGLIGEAGQPALDHPAVRRLRLKLAQHADRAQCHAVDQ
jgi:hypothetical protein